MNRSFYLCTICNDLEIVLCKFPLEHDYYVGNKPCDPYNISIIDKGYLWLFGVDSNTAPLCLTYSHSPNSNELKLDHHEKLPHHKSFDHYAIVQGVVIGQYIHFIGIADDDCYHIIWDTKNPQSEPLQKIICEIIDLDVYEWSLSLNLIKTKHPENNHLDIILLMNQYSGLYVFENIVNNNKYEVHKWVQIIDAIKFQEKLHPFIDNQAFCTTLNKDYIVILGHHNERCRIFMVSIYNLITFGAERIESYDFYTPNCGHNQYFKICISESTKIALENDILIHGFCKMETEQNIPLPIIKLIAAYKSRNEQLMLMPKQFINAKNQRQFNQYHFCHFDQIMEEKQNKLFQKSYFHVIFNSSFFCKINCIFCFFRLVLKSEKNKENDKNKDVIDPRNTYSDQEIIDNQQNNQSKNGRILDMDQDSDLDQDSDTEMNEKKVMDILNEEETRMEFDQPHNNLLKQCERYIEASIDSLKPLQNLNKSDLTKQNQLQRIKDYCSDWTIGLNHDGQQIAICCIQNLLYHIEFTNNYKELDYFIRQKCLRLRRWLNGQNQNGEPCLYRLRQKKRVTLWSVAKIGKTIYKTNENTKEISYADIINKNQNN